MDEYTMADCTYPSWCNCTYPSMGEGRRNDSYYSTTTQSGEGKDVMASRGGCAIACKMDAGLDTYHGSCDGCGVGMTLSCSQAGHYSCLEPVRPSTSFRWSRLGKRTPHLSQPGGCLHSASGGCLHSV